VKIHVTKEAYQELSMAVDPRYIDQFPLAVKLLNKMYDCFLWEEEAEVDPLLEPTELW
jgi:hypothetical protein